MSIMPKHGAKTARTGYQKDIDEIRSDPESEAALQYLNRLSDFLFVMARVANKRGGFEEIPWKPRG